MTTTPVATKPGWRVLPLRRVLARIEQGWSPVAEDRLPDDDEWSVLKLSAVRRGKFVGEESKVLPRDVEPERHLEVRAGDVLVTRANTPDLVGDACFVDRTAPRRMLSDLIYRLRPRGVDPRFLVYALLGSRVRDQISADARGSSQSMVKVSQGHIRSWTILLPDEAEQRRVVQFLDRKTAVVDEIIAKKERLVALLQEKRQALIAQAVGENSSLDPDSQASTRAWPEVQLRRLITGLEQGWSPEAEERVAEPHEPAVLKLGAVFRGTFRESQNKALPRTTALDPRYEIRCGDVLVTRANTVDLVGDACVVGAVRPGLMLPDLIYRLKVRSDLVVPEFLVAFLLSPRGRAQTQADARGSSMSMAKVSGSQLRSWLVPLPPLELQHRVVETLRAGTAKVDACTGAQRRQVAKLREYRQALITAAVTGQIDVTRERAA